MELTRNCAPPIGGFGPQGGVPHIAGSVTHSERRGYVGSSFAAPLRAATNCSTVGTAAAPSGVEYTRHVNPTSLGDVAKGSLPLRRIDGDPAKRYSSASSGVSTRQCSIVCGM